MSDKTKADLIRENIRLKLELQLIHSCISKGVLFSVSTEIDDARDKYPDWPSDIIHQAAIVAEESGELVRAALNHAYHKEPIENARKEAIQTIVTAIRFLEGK